MFHRVLQGGGTEGAQFYFIFVVLWALFSCSKMMHPVEATPWSTAWFLAPTQNTPLWPPRKKFRCIISWERTQKSNPHEPSRGDFWVEKGVLNEPCWATESLLFLFPSRDRGGIRSGHFQPTTPLALDPFYSPRSPPWRIPGALARLRRLQRSLCAMQISPETTQRTLLY